MAACGGEKHAACGDPAPQAIDPSSSQHLLPGAPEPSYNTNPPTSGAHAPGTYPKGAFASPIARPVQVAMLESGRVLLQYRGISTADLSALSVLARSNPDVTMAPNESLPAPIVATAWLYLMRCERFDKRALQDFVSMHVGKNQAD